MSISRNAIIGSNVAFGEYVVIEDDVQIGSGVEISHHVVIRSGVRIGDNCKILDGSILGKRPAKASLSATTGAHGVFSPKKVAWLLLNRTFGVTRIE